MGGWMEKPFARKTGQTDRQTDGWMEERMDGQTKIYRQTTSRLMNIWMDGWTDSQMKRQTGRQTESETEIMTETDNNNR